MNGRTIIERALYFGASLAGIAAAGALKDAPAAALAHANLLS